MSIHDATSRFVQSPVKAQHMPGDSFRNGTVTSHTAGVHHPLEGAILSIDNSELAVYCCPVRNQPHATVFFLLADGTITIETIHLGQHRVSEMGLLAPEELRMIELSHRWSRSLIAARCWKKEDADRIPEPSASHDTGPGTHSYEHGRSLETNGHANNHALRETADAREKTNHNGHSAGRTGANEGAAAPNSLKRGQRIALIMGPRSWESVYWGSDHLGGVVAHGTNGRWTLIRLDLERFKTNIKILAPPDTDLIERISADLRSTVESQET